MGDDECAEELELRPVDCIIVIGTDDEGAKARQTNHTSLLEGDAVSRPERTHNQPLALLKRNHRLVGSLQLLVLMNNTFSRRSTAYCLVVRIGCCLLHASSHSNTATPSLCRGGCDSGSHNINKTPPCKSGHHDLADSFNVGLALSASTSDTPVPRTTRGPTSRQESSDLVSAQSSAVQ